MRVLIVGAGVAGLAAARHLHLTGHFRDVTILEASAHIGGRLHTANFGDGQVELGAEWVHGQEDNVVFALASSNGLVQLEAPLRPIFKFSKLPFSADEQEIAEDLVAYLEAVQEQIPFDAEETSLAAILDKSFQDYLQGSQHEGLCKAVYSWYCHLQCEINGCTDLADVSAQLLSEYHHCAGNPIVELKYGYQAFVDLLARDLPREWIHLNTPVTKICWDTQPLTIETASSQTWAADHVIVTVPLGYLKAHGNTLFKPVLPKKKMESINTIGFGTINKIFIAFKNPFWKPGDIFQVVWREKPKFIQAGWWESIGWFSSLENNPSVLCAWVSGPGALEVEHLPESEILVTLHAVLEALLAPAELPAPSHLLMSRWSSAEFTRGSYSYLSRKCEQTGSLPQDLAEPLYLDNVPVVLFGGEATHSHYYSTVHGAFESGIREAERLLHRKQSPIESPPKAPFNISRRSPSVVIVGAGAAGLGAAHYLTHWGFSDITVLEAMGRTGGRILTYKQDGLLLELGAQWVHGEEGNPLYDLANRNKLLADPRKDYSVEGRGIFCTETGHRIPDSVVNSTIMALDSIKEEIEKLMVDYPSVGELFCQKFEYYSSTQSSTQSDKRYLQGIFDWYMRYELIDNACSTMNELSPLGYAEWQACPGEYTINFKDGFQSFINFLCQQSKAKIMLNKPVRTIHWKKPKSSPGPPLEVEIENGERIPADHVIVTSSIQVLKKTTSLFEPPLPKKKRELIHKMGFGAINKIYLIYETPFWGEKDLGFQLIWTVPHKTRDDDWWTSWISGFDRVRKASNVLVGWIGGPGAEFMESLPDSQVLQTCHKILQQFLNDPTLPAPVKVVRSRWNSEPYIQGAYSYRPLGYSRRQVLELSEPLCTVHKHYSVPRVQFAGEATDIEFFSTVHGALRSGHREALRLYSNLRYQATPSSCKL